MNSIETELLGALERAEDMLSAIAGDIEDGYSLSGMREKYVLSILGVRDHAKDVIMKAKGDK